MISNEPKSEHLFQIKGRGNQQLDVGYVTGNTDKFYSNNAKTRKKVENKDSTIEENNEPHSNDIEIDLTKFRSN